MQPAWVPSQRFIKTSLINDNYLFYIKCELMISLGIKNVITSYEVMQPFTPFKLALL